MAVNTKLLCEIMSAKKTPFSSFISSSSRGKGSGSKEEKGPNHKEDWMHRSFDLLGARVFKSYDQSLLPNETNSSLLNVLKELFRGSSASMPTILISCWIDLLVGVYCVLSMYACRS